MNIGFQLFQLQEIDSAIDKAQKRIDEINTMIANDKTVREARSKLKSRKNCLSKKKMNSIN